MVGRLGTAAEAVDRLVKDANAELDKAQQRGYFSITLKPKSSKVTSIAKDFMQKVFPGTAWDDSDFELELRIHLAGDAGDGS